MRPRRDPCCGPDAAVDADGVPDRSYFRTRATAPGPSGPQMLAAARRTSTDPLGFLRAARQRHGPVVQFPVPRPPTFLVDDPHIVRQILVAYDSDFDKETVQYRALARVTGQGLLAAPNARWRQQRPVVQPAFHHGVLERFAADADGAAQRLVRRWSQAPAGSVVDVEAAMMHVGLEVVGAHLFDADLSRTAPRLAAATQHALDAVVQSVRPPWAFFGGLPTPAHRRFTRAVGELDAAVTDLLRQRAAAEARHDLLGLLLDAYPDDPITVRNQIITFLVAGHETVASVLTWTLGLLAHHPVEQARVRNEVDAALPGRSAGPSDAARLPALRACIDEGLRMYPPAWVITRSTAVRTVLGGREVPAGSLIIISPWLLHRDPDTWPRPDDFVPSRFGSRPGARARAGTTRGEYLPFGAGQRLCIGRDMALLEASIVLAALLRTFAFRPAAARLPDADPLVALRPKGGLRLRVQARAAASGQLLVTY